MADMLLFDKEHKSMVQAISSQIRQSLDLDDILNTTVRELGSHLDASRCCLAILDTHGTPNVCDDELSFNYVWYDEERGGTELQNQSILITDTSVLRTILEQGSIMSLDILESEQTPLFENAAVSPDEWKSIRSLIACPISTKNGPLGMILVHQCDRLRLWTNSELELVEAVASQVTVALEHGRLYDRSRRMAEQEILINHIVRSVRSSLDLDTILNTVTRELLHALGVERVQIAQPKGDNPLMITHEFTVEGYESGVGVSMYSDNLDFTPKDNRRHARSTVRNTVLGINLEGLLDSTGSDEDEAPVSRQMSLADQATTLREAPIAIVNDTEADSRCIPFRPFVEQLESQALIAAPLLHESRLVGLLIVHQCSGTRAWKTSDVALVTAIADQLAIAITHASLFAQVRHQAITDGLTSLYNHVYFKNRLKEELNLADRKGTSCSLIMIDLDKLKYINDSFGHPIGDAAIRQVASILKTMLRSGDTAARYGGEEFAVILPETSLLEAALIADRLCTRIRNSHVTGLGRITASLGAASYPKQAITAEELVEKADRALYKSKNSGRDQANIYEPDEVVNDVISLPAPGPMTSGSSISASEPGSSAGGSIATLPSSNSAVADKPTAQMIDVPLIDIQIQSAEDSFAADPLQERPGT
jgi:diguanylate cyclase (GGDEF) domain